MKFILLALLFYTITTKAQNGLEYYVQMAKKNSPLVNDSKKAKEANNVDAERIKALYRKPVVAVTANYQMAPVISTDNGKTTLTINPYGTSNYLGYDLGLTNGGQYQLLLGVNQPLFNGQQFKVEAEQINVVSQSLDFNIKLSEHDIEKVVTDQYLKCLLISKQIENTEKILKIFGAQKEILIKLVENLILKQTDLALFNIEYQNFLIEYEVLKSNYHSSLMELNILCGINDTLLVRLSDIHLTLKASQTPGSLFLEKYRLDSLSLAAKQNVIELKYKPQINLFANTGFNANYLPNLPNRFGFSVGLTFTYTIFDGHQRTLSRKVTRIKEEAIMFSRDNFINQNDVRKAKILNDLKSCVNRTAIVLQQLNDYNELMSQYQKQIAFGQISILEYVQAMKNMVNKQSEYLALNFEQQFLINAYNYWNW